ncbi:MAG: acetate kinase, partial [Synergistaceae bacterium]|nr:acetate kinase [Synergistaceae bacterium]
YLREAADGGDERSRLAIEMFVDGVVRYVGSYYAFLGGLDHLVFTGGIGENDVRLRADVCEKISHFGVVLDDEKNRTDKAEGLVSTVGSSVKVHVIPADEEVIVARKTYEFR